MIFGIIYKATNKINNKMYIGKTTKGLFRRRTEHLCFNEPKTYFQSAIRKYGPESFEWEILKECSSREELDSSEIFFIGEFKSNTSKIGYNLTGGGDGFAYGELNPVHRPEVKDKIIKALKSNNGSFRPEVKKKMSAIFKGRKLSEEHKRSISSGLIGHASPTGSDHSKSKKWIVVFPDETEEEIKGLREFCRNHNLNAKLMRRTSRDFTKVHKGFKLREIDE